MTKADIVNEITKKTGIDKQTVLTTVEAFMDAVKDSLSKDENVYLRGFGSFVVKKRAQKTNLKVKFLHLVDKKNDYFINTKFFESYKQY